MVRREGSRSTKNLWIFCEGKKTETFYFKKLRHLERIDGLQIKVFTSGNTDAVGIIEHAQKFIEHRKDYVEGDFVCCVFDRDQNQNSVLAQAKRIAEQANICLIFSNPCFEYWVLCHFGSFHSRYSPDDVIDKIKEYLPEYRKNDSETYSKVKEKTQIANNNAKVIHKKHIEKNVEIISCESNPVTLVFHLIDKIFEFVR
ncbi:hypothetical protein GF327_00865 [Candidatus Woesearchaeota archaeon]|nr:hypothetical protein [Candidatus Woesearchaeota archaeon]